MGLSPPLNTHVGQKTIDHQLFHYIVERLMCFKTFYKMPLTKELSVPKEHFVIHMIVLYLNYLKTFLKPLTLVLVGSFFAFLDTPVLGQVTDMLNIDALPPFAKGLSAVVSIILTGMGGWVAYGKFRFTAYKDRMDRVDWLIARKFLKEEATPEEVEKALQDYF